MKVYQCKVCGVEFYEGHDTCPFCREPASTAKLIGTKEERFNSTNIYQGDVCEKETTKCEERHSDSKVYDYQIETPKSYVPKTVREAQASSEYNNQPIYNSSRPNAVAGKGVIYLIFGILSIFWGAIFGIINIVFYKSANKTDWTDSERRMAKMGVNISIVVMIIQALMILATIMAFVISFSY